MKIESRLHCININDDDCKRAQNAKKKFKGNQCPN